MAEENDRTGMIQIDLSDAEIKQRSDKLATEELEREALLAKKATHNREWNEQLKQSRDRIKQLATEVDSGKAWVPAQANMFGSTSNGSDEEEEETPPPAGRRRRRRSEPPELGAA
jgi:multidrug resistance efflux pump